MSCPLCRSAKNSTFFEDSSRSWVYFECSLCYLVYRDPQTYLGAAVEKTRYETHNNSIEDEGYVNFLTPVVTGLVPFLKKGDQGLDFGCGPGPILDQLFKPHEVAIKNYDPFFYNFPELLENRYDFITCTEAFEHFYRPGQELSLLHKLLKPEGYLLIMTEKRKALPDFAKWGYRMDYTHVCFLSDATIDWIKEKWNYELIFSKGRLSLFRKN